MTKPSRPRVERAAGAGRIVVAGGHGADDGEGAEAERSERRLRPAGDHHVRLAPGDGAEPLADRDGARRAAHPVGGVGAGAAELDGDVAAGGPGEHGERQRGIHGARAPGSESCGTAPRRRPRRRARCPSWRRPGRESSRREVEVRIRQSHPGGRDAELGEAVQPAGAALLDVVGGVEVIDLARDSGLEHAGVEPGDAADGGVAGR